jgi:hypothetical protein
VGKLFFPRSLAVPPIIHDLVAKFSEFQETYKAEKYNETQLRRYFLRVCHLRICHEYANSTAGRGRA